MIPCPRLLAREAGAPTAADGGGRWGQRGLRGSPPDLQCAALPRAGVPRATTREGNEHPLRTHEGGGPKRSVCRQPPLPSRAPRLGCGALTETRPWSLTSCSDSGTSAGTMGRFTPRCSFSFSPPFSFPFSASPFSAWVIVTGDSRESPASASPLDRGNKRSLRAGARFRLAAHSQDGRPGVAAEDSGKRKSQPFHWGMVGAG